MQHEILIALIRKFHRERCYLMETRKSLDLRLLSELRWRLGWSRNLPDGERKAIAQRAMRLVETAEKIAKGKSVDAIDPAYEELSSIIEATIAARARFDKGEAEAVKQMEKLAKQLDVWAVFGEGVKGFGPKSLAVIVAEAGDLSNYPDHSKLWKRMGLAVINGVRQGGLQKSARAEKWIEHGYNRKRRSHMWNIGDALIKAGGPYADLYRARKEVERGKAQARGLTVAPAAKIPKSRAHEFISDGHIHRRAQRYMEKRLLRDLWKAWRRANLWLHQKDDSRQVPAAVPYLEAAE